MRDLVSPKVIMSSALRRSKNASGFLRFSQPGLTIYMGNKASTKEKVSLQIRSHRMVVIPRVERGALMRCQFTLRLRAQRGYPLTNRSDIGLEVR